MKMPNTCRFTISLFFSKSLLCIWQRKLRGGNKDNPVLKCFQHKFLQFDCCVKISITNQVECFIYVILSRRLMLYPFPNQYHFQLSCSLVLNILFSYHLSFVNQMLLNGQLIAIDNNLNGASLSKMDRIGNICITVNI